LGAYLPLLLIVVAFWFLIIRPARKRQQEQQAVISALAPGARVMTTAGLFGTVVSLEDGEVALEIAPGVVVRYVAAAVAKVVEAAPAATERMDGDAGQGERPSLFEGDTQGS
jgi:preprotein translocase subunit YajC